MAEVKVCSKCKQEKPLKDFYKNNNSSDGRQHACITCHKDRWKHLNEHRKDVLAKYNERAKLYDDKHIEKYLWGIARSRAKEKGLEFTIQPSDIVVPDVCPILLVPMERNRGKLNKNSYSLDRIDSSKGYIPGNVAVISFKANQIKEDFSIEEVERLLKYMKGT